jgi:biofilm protein TabA
MGWKKCAFKAGHFKLAAAGRQLGIETPPASVLSPGMAFFGPLATVRQRCAPLPEFQAALAYAAEALTPGSPVHARIAALAGGTNHRQELGGGAYAVEMAYLTKPRAEGFFETHRKYIDVQVLVAGDELMELAPVSRLGVTQPYDPAKDFAKHTDTRESSVLRATAGDVAIFWPEDAHMPSLAVNAPALVRKTVVKVPVGS